MSDMWCMRGVSEEAKKAAKVGAAGQGVTLGRWVEMAIVAHASWAGSAAAVADNPIPKLTVETVRLLKDQLSGPNARPKKREVKLCPHGEAKGNNCWQCGGLAKIEEK